MSDNWIPGRRGGGIAGEAPKAPPVRLTMSGAGIMEARQQIVDLMAVLNIRHTVKAEGESLMFEIDPRAIHLVPVYIRALRSAGPVAKEAQITSEQLNEVHLRARALSALLHALELLNVQLEGSRLIIAAAQGSMWDDLVAAVQRIVTDEHLSLEQRAQMKADAADLLLQVEHEQTDKRRRLDELKGARTAAEQQVAAATARRRQLQALLNLQDNQEIDPEMLDSLQRIYVDKVRVPGEERRTVR